MPFVPFLPALSIVVNTILMTTLHALTWLRLLVWITVGLTGYFVYGVQHSKLNKKPESNGRQALESPSNGKQQNSHL
ncbi:unnamed protein product [Ixodes hexagonus]